MAIILEKRPKALDLRKPPKKPRMTFCQKYKPSMQLCGVGAYTAAAPIAETM